MQSLGQKQQVKRLLQAKNECLENPVYQDIKIPKKYIKEYYSKVYKNRANLRVDLETDFIKNNILAVACSNFLSKELYKYYVGSYEYRYAKEQNYIAFHFEKCRNTQTGYIKDSYNKCTYLPNAPVKYYHDKSNVSFNTVINSAKIERKVSLYKAITGQYKLNLTSNILV